MSDWYVYLLRCADDTLYCGITTDLKRRVAQHNKGVAAKYTRARTPVTLETYTEVKSKSEALKLELKIKKQTKSVKIDYLIKYRAQSTQ
jgi:putative endonuclease